MTNQEQVIADIAREVVARLRAQLQQPTSAPAPTNGSATAAAQRSVGARGSLTSRRPVDRDRQQRSWRRRLCHRRRGRQRSRHGTAAGCGDEPEERGKMIAIIRRICNDRSEELGRMELEETKVGRLDHKIQKLEAIRSVLAWRPCAAMRAATAAGCA